MKNRVAQILGLGLALVAVGGAQTQGQAVKADVPFMFYVGSTLMPQGAYRILPYNSSVAWIKSTEKDMTEAVITINVSSLKRAEPARLVFHRYGEDYFLSQIWTGGQYGRALPQSTQEKELARSGRAPTLAVIQVILHH